ncbi:MAG: ABC transporter substrate-binding protein [Chloroflexota bacterium]
MKYRKLAIFIILASLLVSIAPLTAQETECEDGFRLFEHFAGETCIPENPQRVVTLQDQNLLLPIWELGFRNIVGSTGRFDANGEGFFRRMETQGFDPEGVEFVGGGEPNFEAILGLEPDLIVGTEFDEEIYDQLSAIAPTVLIEIFGEPRFEEVMVTLGDLVGMEEAVEQLEAEYLQGIADLQAAVDDPSEVVISIIETSPSGGAEPGQFYISGAANSSVETVLRAAGFARPAPQLEVTERTFYSVEVLQEHDADLLIRVFFAQEDPDEEQANTEAVLGSPLWGLLNAVEKDQAFDLDSDSTFGYGYTVRLTVIGILLELLEDLDTTGDLSTVDIAVPEPVMDDMDDMEMEATEEEISATLCEDGFRSFESAIGAVCVPNVAQRIVATHDFNAGVQVLSLGGPLVGIPSRFGELAPDITQFFDLNDIQTVGQYYEPNIETILQLEPDLIVHEGFNGDQWFYQGGEATLEALNAIAPVVIIDTFRPIEEVMADYQELLGDAATVQLEEQQAEFDALLEEIEAALDNSGEDFTVGYISFNPTGGFYQAWGPSALVPLDILTRAGVNWVPIQMEAGEDGGYLGDISIEALDEFSGDIVMIETVFDPELPNDPLIREFPAVQTGQTILLDVPIAGTHYANYIALAEIILEQLEAIEDLDADLVFTGESGE